MTDLHDLRTAIDELSHPLLVSNTSFDLLTSRVVEHTVKRGQHLCRVGDAAGHLYFVRSGLLRYYYLTEGTEHTGQFFAPGSFVADVYAMTEDRPALQNIDVLQDGRVLAIPRQALLAAYDSDHAFERFGRRMIEKAMAGSQRRTASLLMKTPEQRYTDFATGRAGLLELIPQYVIASYLGITPESLSRIRARRVRKG